MSDLKAENYSHLSAKVIGAKVPAWLARETGLSDGDLIDETYQNDPFAAAKQTSADADAEELTPPHLVEAGEVEAAGWGTTKRAGQSATSKHGRHRKEDAVASSLLEKKNVINNFRDLMATAFVVHGLLVGVG